MSLVSWCLYQLTKEQQVFFDILVKKGNPTVQPKGKPKPDATSPPTAEVRCPFDACLTGQELLYHREVVQEKFNTSDRLKKCLQYSKHTKGP
jgi:hypothetical protein